jgi:hypothetical protein
MATMTVDVYKNQLKLGSGSCTDGGATATVTSWTALDSAYVMANRNIQIIVTDSNSRKGQQMATRCTADNGAGTLTLADAFPF